MSSIFDHAQPRLNDQSSTIRINRPKIALTAKRWQTVTRALVGYAARYRPSRVTGESRSYGIPTLPRTGQILPFRTVALNVSRSVTEKPLYRKLPIMPIVTNRTSFAGKNLTMDESTFGHISGYAAHARLVADKGKTGKIIVVFAS